MAKPKVSELMTAARAWNARQDQSDKHSDEDALSLSMIEEVLQDIPGGASVFVFQFSCDVGEDEESDRASSVLDSVVRDQLIGQPNRFGQLVYFRGEWWLYFVISCSSATVTEADLVQFCINLVRFQDVEWDLPFPPQY